MTLLTIPNVQVPLTEGGERINREWYRFLHDVTDRCGGVTGASTNDLLAAAFDDAGIEETKAELFRLRDELHGVESLVYALMARVQVLEREVWSLKQGTLV